MRKRAISTPAGRLFRTLASQTGLACTGLALISATIAGNALLLQGGRHPAPLFVTRNAAPETGPETREQGDLIVQAVQQSLASAGLYAGPVDGVAGPQTRAAILRFERETGRPEMGEPTPDLIAAVEAWNVRANLGGADAVEDEATAAAATGDPTVLAVQEALARAAYGPLNVDGVFGQQTRDAITRFQLDEGLPLTGAIDADLIARLKRLGALDGA